MTKRRWIVALFPLVMLGCDKKPGGAGSAASASAAAPAAAACETVAPAGYCIAVPAGYKRDDSLFVDNVLKEKGGGKNIWHNRTEGKAYDDGSQITITYDPDAASYDTWRGFLEDEAKKADLWKEPPAVQDLASGTGRYFRGTRADGKWIEARSIAKGAKFWVECKATSPAKAPDNAALDACKTIAVK